MADLIDRAQAMKLLSGEAVGKYPQSFCFGLFAATKEIDSLPAVDAVEVVRCKDCKDWIRHSGHASYSPTGACFIWAETTLGEDFCSYGERRTDGSSDRC